MQDITVLQLVGILTAIIGVMAVLIGSLIKIMHNQAMLKLDGVIESNHEIKETVVEHNIKIDYTAQEIIKLWAYNKEQDDKLYKYLGEVRGVKAAFTAKGII